MIVIMLVNVHISNICSSFASAPGSSPLVLLSSTIHAVITHTFDRTSASVRSVMPGSARAGLVHGSTSTTNASITMMLMSWQLHLLALWKQHCNPLTECIHTASAELQWSDFMNAARGSTEDRSLRGSHYADEVSSVLHAYLLQLFSAVRDLVEVGLWALNSLVSSVDGEALTDSVLAVHASLCACTLLQTLHSALAACDATPPSAALCKALLRPLADAVKQLGLYNQVLLSSLPVTPAAAQMYGSDVCNELEQAAAGVLGRWLCVAVCGHPVTAVELKWSPWLCVSPLSAGVDSNLLEGRHAALVEPVQKQDVVTVAVITPRKPTSKPSPGMQAYVCVCA